MKRIIACLLMIICIAGAQTRGLAKQEWAEAFDGLLSLLGIQTETKEKNAMNYQEIAERIRKTGIAVSDEIVTDLEKNTRSPISVSRSLRRPGYFSKEKTGSGKEQRP